MLFLKGCFNHLYTKYATVNTFAKIMSIVTPIIVIKEHLIALVNSYIPSYVERIVHFDTEDGIISERYIAYKKGYSMKNALYEMMDLPKDGYYMFVMWNNLKQSYEHFILQANLVKSALEIRNVYNLWTLHDFAISIMLSNFITYSTLGVPKIIGITINGKDITKQIKPYIKCISIPNNVRPNVLYMLSNYLDDDCYDINYREANGSICTYITEEMNEIQINESNKYIVPSIVKNNTIYRARPSLYECGDINNKDREDDDEDKNENDDKNEIGEEQESSEEDEDEDDEEECCDCCEYNCEEDEGEDDNKNIKKRKLNILDDDTIAYEDDANNIKDKDV